MTLRRRPPRLGLWLLDRCEVGDDLTGDLLEELERGRSRSWFWAEVVAAASTGMWRTAPRYARSSLTGALCGITAIWIVTTIVSQALLRLGWLSHAVEWRLSHYLVLLVSGFACTVGAGWIVAQLHRAHPTAAVLGFCGFIMIAPVWQLPLLYRFYPAVFEGILPHLPFFLVSIVLVAPLSILVGGRLGAPIQTAQPR